ncbi:Endogenous retrovirus group K member 8 Pol protein [Lonchura striata]|uniref:Endogenous retrovirus group K member 8 Pol protein n=1 Tax=Lonchura striata TaxID=40157 RepID=A0A218VDB3_9PASE|nr:Endogenous retrovirus group K member 8 Pol protein [Lonchura striata domestica]
MYIVLGDTKHTPLDITIAPSITPRKSVKQDYRVCWAQKPGKDEWRLLHDLRAINAAIEDMGSPQPGMPSPAMLPENWNLAIIDIKNCFFQIPLHPDDTPRFAFSVPSINREAPMKRYHWKATEGVVIHHYMDDILICAPNDDLLTHALELTTSALVAAGFELRKDKIQRMPPWKYLGLEIGKRTIVPQKLAIKNTIRNLADVQQLCGSLNWVRPWLGISNEDLAPLFNLLKGGDEPSSPRELTPEAKAALERVQEAMSTRQAHRCDPGLPFKFIIMGRLPHLHGIIFQWTETLGKGTDQGKRDPLSIIEWVLLSHTRSKRLTKPQELVAELIRKARMRIWELAGVDFKCIHIPLKLESGQFTKAMLEHLLPAHKIFDSDVQFELKTTRIQSKKPLKALTVFTDLAELAAVVRAFERFSEPFNLVTDSAYVAGVVSRAQDAILQGVTNEALNDLLSKLLAPLPEKFQQAKISHQFHHQNAPGLVREFRLTRDQAKAIVATCPSCKSLPLPSKYVHVSVDTFSGAVFASAHTGERAKDVEKHLVQAFSMLGVPKLIKTDNAPGYTSREFASFLQQWGIEHKTGIAYSPSGQAVVERTHQNIKRMLKQQLSASKNESPQVQLSRALFTLNFLNCSFNCLNPPIVRHFSASEQSRVREKPPVLIKNPETWRQEGPYDLVTWGRGYACVSTPSGLRWVPSKFVRPYVPKTTNNRPSSPQLFFRDTRSTTGPPKMISIVSLILLGLSIAPHLLHSWIVPQPPANVWTTLAKSLNQDHLCLSTSSAANPFLSCLVGIPYPLKSFPFTLPPNASAPPTKSRASIFFTHTMKKPELWRKWVGALPLIEKDPEELELLGSSLAYTCIHFFVSDNPFAYPKREIVQTIPEYLAKNWCDQVLHIPGFSTPDNQPHALPKGVFLICGNRAWAGIPPHLVGGPCTFGQLSLFTPNKTHIAHWKALNQSGQLARKKRDTDLVDLDENCKDEVTHWSKMKSVVTTAFLPWLSIAQAFNELAGLECWVVKQANITSAALSNLLTDEETTRQATLQNRAAIDFLLLLHNHRCEEFAGLCCMNLTSKAEDVRTSISRMQEMIHHIQKESAGWLDSLFEGWGLAGWMRSLIQTAIMLLLGLIIFIVGFSVIKKLLIRALNNTINVNHAALADPHELQPLNEEEQPPEERPNENIWFDERAEDSNSPV